MKRLSVFGFVGLLAGVLTGCPIFNENDPGPCPGRDYGTCGGTTTVASGGPSPVWCSTPSQCVANETCGSDGQCHPGDCTFYGCVNGYVCTVGSDQTASCQPSGTTSSTNGSGGASSSSSSNGGATSSSSNGGATSTGVTTSNGGAGGGGPVYCGHPADCAAGQTCAPNGTCEAGDCTTLGCIFGFTCDISKVCKPNDPANCGADADCASTPGSVCVSGKCTLPQDQCFDGSQCPSGDKCVAGKCTTACAADAACRDGFACDTTLGICSKPLAACTITNDCGGPSEVCVDGACVPRSPGGVCSTGDVWVENGCIPSQTASFICQTDGAQDVCSAGSLCLHHSCYIACTIPDTAKVCNNPTLNVCKSVTTTSGSHDVCGSNENLGGECDPTKLCASGKICIDGFCR